MSGVLKLDTREADRLAKAIGTNIADIVNSAASDILSEAQRRVPVRTGALRSSGRVSKRASRASRAAAVTFGNDDVTYAEHVEYGTAPHIILPVNKQALYWPGADHPVKRVNHPGTPAKPFLQPAAEHVGNLYNSGAVWQELVK